MNDIELQNIESMFGTTEGKTMEDYFSELNGMLSIDVNDLKSNLYDIGCCSWTNF